MSEYEAPWYLRNNIAMWAWANGVRRIPKPDYELPFERLSTPLGSEDSFFELAWLRVKSGEAGERVALFAPGLSGGAYSKPTCGMVRALNKKNWDVAVWVFRDTGTRPTSVRRTYSGYGLEDLKVAVAHLKTIYQGKPIALVGTSLGGAAVLQYAAREDDQDITKVVSISPPIDFGACVESWSRGLRGKLVISPLVKKGMQSKARRKVSTGAITRNDVKAYGKVRTVTEADHYINSKFNDYDSASDYWYKATTARDLWVCEFTADTLIITARDDYLLDPRSYPNEDSFLRKKNLQIEMPRYGSHVGFVQRGISGLYWSEERTVAHLNS